MSEYQLNDDDARSIAEASGKALRSVAPQAALTLGGEEIGSIARRHWALAVEMGWPALLVAEEHDGLGLGVAEAAALNEQMGRELFCGPFVASAVLVPSLARFAPSDGWGLLALSVASGDAVVSLATMPVGQHWSRADTLLSTRGVLVEHPELATHFLVVDVAAIDASHVEFHAAVLERGEAAVIHPRQPLDVTCPVADVEFARASPLAGTIVSCRLERSQYEELMQPLHVVVAAELVGVAQRALDGAVAYAKERRQFDVPIGSFQSIKHKLADTAMLVANARLAVRHAATRMSTIATQAARALATEAALRAAGDYIQLQGGLGFSWESEAHLYLKRARRVASVLGNAIESRRIVANEFIESVVQP